MRALLVVLALTGVAHGESERSLSLGLGWATFSAPGEPVNNMEPVAIGPDYGGALAIGHERMIGTDLGLRLELAGGVFYGGGTPEQSKTTTVLLADVGVVFRFDVLKYVPYAFGGVGALTTFGGPIDEGTSAALTVGGGLDMLVSRSRSYGFEGKLASFGGDVTVFTLGVRGTVRWGYF
ncbi:MAG: hypothetical protein AB7P03_20610 [Kofleriaceae bacterium]